jgi:photosystem II stability/assembly factor-like uncharacterized protein
MPAPLKMSQDGGASWTDVSPSGMGSVRDVAIGIDGRMMFAAAQTGVWRATTP